MTTADIQLHAISAPTQNRTMITIVLVLAALMQALDTTIVNVALPHMQAGLNSTQDQISWVLTSYIVAAAIMTPATGFLAARIGRTRLFVISMIGFTVASVLCGLATSIGQMVAFRLLQGVFGAALMPLSQAILLDTYSRAEMGRAMAIWGIGTLVGPILGPTLGGYLTAEYTWRWCFYINLPVGIFAVIGALTFIGETSLVRERKFDAFGFAFLTLAIGCLQLALDRGEEKGWLQSTEIQIELALAIFGFYMFTVHSLTTARPFVDLGIFKDRNFVISMLLIMAVGMVFNGSMILVPQMLQTELNYPVLTTGLIMGPRGIGMVAAMMLFGKISNRADPRLLIFLGLMTVGGSMYVMSGWSLMVGSQQIITTGMIQGFGLGLIFAPVYSLAFYTMPTELRTEASGFFALVRNVGGAIGISIVASRLIELTQSNHAYLGSYMTPFRLMPGLHLPTTAAALEALNLNITLQAGMIAYVNVFRLLAVLSVLFSPLLLLVKSGQQQAGAPAAAMDH
jgi:DHA2 family multidrug resistance protein